MRSRAQFLFVPALLAGWLGGASAFHPTELQRLPFPPFPRGYTAGPSRFSLETTFASTFSTFQSEGQTLGQGSALFLATLGFAATSNAVIRVTLGYDLVQWSAGTDARWGQSLGLSNIKGVSFDWRGPDQWAVHLQYGQDRDSLTGFGRFRNMGHGWLAEDDPFIGASSLDSLSIGASKSFLGDRLKMSLLVVTPELGLRRN